MAPTVFDEKTREIPVFADFPGFWGFQKRVSFDYLGR